MAQKKPAKPGAKKQRKFQSEPSRKTARYQPTMRGHPLFMPDSDLQPKFTWADVPRMRRDPTVLMAARIIQAPLFQASIAVGADATAVEGFVRKTFSRVWTRALNKILRYLDYGHAAGESTYCTEHGRFAFNQLHDVHPLDAKPLRLNGQFVGVRVGNLRGVGVANGDLAPPNAFWVTHAAEYGQLYGRSVYEGAWEPWWEKCAKHGGKDIRRLWFLKNAYSGGTIRHPPGETEVGDNKFISNHDLAAEILQKLETGGVMILPNTTNLKGEFLWSYDPPKINGELTGLLDYIRMLDREILIGMGVPPEILEAAEVGSGWSGRSVPFKVFFSTLDQFLMEIVEAVDRLIVRHLVAANFGPQAAADYEVRPISLVRQAEKESAPDPGAPDSPNIPPTRDQAPDQIAPAPMPDTRRAVRGAVRGQAPVRRLSLLEFAEEMTDWTDRRLRRTRRSGRHTVSANGKA